MTIFRHKKNGLLYTIEKVSPRMVLGSWHEAKPFNHDTPVYARKKHVDMNEFVAVYHT